MYCLGKTREFRAKNGDGIVVCNNDEMLLSVKVAGGNAQSLNDGDKKSASNLVVTKRRKGQIPFGTFTLYEYFRYQRALVDEKPLSKEDVSIKIKKVGLNCPLNTKLKKLSSVEYRALSFAIKLQKDTKETYLNFEGLKYCRKNKKLLTNFLTKLDRSYSVYVNLSDNRFVPKAR